MYAWIIDRDFIADGEAIGACGPADAPDDVIDLLFEHNTDKAHTYKFRLLDDDGNLYYTGRLFTDEGASEAACYAPLGDFGAPNAGCTDVRYPDRPAMDCG